MHTSGSVRLKFFLITLIFLFTLSVMSLYYRYMILHDYTVYLVAEE